MEAPFSPMMDFSRSSGGKRAEVLFHEFTRSVAQAFETSFWMILTDDLRRCALQNFFMS
jgi:hypothetical protein